MNPANIHPLYTIFSPLWKKMEDCYGGEQLVKDKSFSYLPATPGQLVDGIENVNRDGYKNYAAYKMRARFPDFVQQAVAALLGIMHRKPAIIKLPTRIKSLFEKATIKGESLTMLLRRINTAQLVTGRVGLLADISEDADPSAVPYIAMYDADDILNWDDRGRGVLEFVSLDETQYVRKDIFEWEQIQKCRVLLLNDGRYQTGSFSGDFDQKALVEPSLAGRILEKLPFIIINSKDIVADPDNPPLLGLAELAIAVYRQEADYRQSLFMQGQDTLVIIGGLAGDDAIRAGAGAKIEVAQGGDAKYIGASSQGIPEMRQSLENDRREASEVGGRLMNTSRDAESGDALRIRVSARTASLNQISLAGAEGLQTILRIIAEWVGANPEEVEVIPNLDFADDTLDGSTLVSFMTAKNLGAPISNASIHELLVEKELTKKTYEEELAAIEEEGIGLAPVPQQNQDIEQQDQE